MADNKNTITKEQVNELIETVGAVNDDVKEIQDMKHAKEKSIEELVSEHEEGKKRIRMKFNPETGAMESSHIASDYGTDSDNTIFEDFDDLVSEDYSPGDFSDESIKKALNKEINLKDDTISLKEIDDFRKLLIKKQKNNIKFNELPETLQKEINKFIMSQASFISSSKIKEIRTSITNELMDSIINDILQDNLSKIYVDLDTSIKNTIKTEGDTLQREQYHTYYNTFVNKFPEMAKQKDDPKQVKLLMDISEGFKQAHSLENMYKAFHSKGYMKIKKIDIEKLHKRIRDFNIKYNNSRLTINNMEEAENILARHVNQRFSIDVIKGLIVTFCNYTYNMTPENIAEHTFMYYFVFNILSLDVPLTNEEDIRWRNEFIENVNHFLSAIEDKMRK